MRLPFPIRAAAVAALPLVAAACASSPPRFAADSAHAAVTTLASELEANFVYPDIGRAYAARLRESLAAGRYDGAASPAGFAQLVTRDLQAVNREGHLRLVPPGATQADGPGAGVQHLGRGVVRAGWIAPGVGYMSIHGFGGDEAEYAQKMRRVRAVLDTLAGARTLIVDARSYVGGALEETDVVASYLFADTTTLLEFDTRAAVEARGRGVLRDGPRLVRVEAPEGIVRRRQLAIPVDPARSLRAARVFVLTSRHTASGGEGFTLAMRREGRATIIGDTTAGAGHFGSNVQLGGGYHAFVPIGRPFDPATGRGWELVGIAPDVAVPADRALDEALRRAGIDVARGRAAVERLPVP